MCRVMSLGHRAALPHRPQKYTFSPVTVTPL
jgi:hypothetical protein